MERRDGVKTAESQHIKVLTPEEGEKQAKENMEYRTKMAKIERDN